MKRILITGAAGFIGFHLAKKLCKNSIVLGLDNFNDYYDVQLKKDRALYLNQFDVEVLNKDITDENSFLNVVKSFKPTHVVHLAAQAGVRYSTQNPHAYIQSNVVGFTYVLEALKKKNIPLIYASSSSVYGDCQEIPFSESTTQDHPINLYGATKKANEIMAYSYHKLYQMQVIGLRFFTVYGPWGRPDMAYYAFTNKIFNQEPINVYDGQGIERDFTYIDDIIEGITSTLDYPGKCEVFNLGNNEPVKLNDFISTLEETLGQKAIKNYMPQALGDMEKTYADISKAQKHLNFSPKTSLKTGLEHFANWYCSYHQKSAELSY